MTLLALFKQARDALIARNDYAATLVWSEMTPANEAEWDRLCAEWERLHDEFGRRVMGGEKFKAKDLPQVKEWENEMAAAMRQTAAFIQAAAEYEKANPNFNPLDKNRHH